MGRKAVDILELDVEALLKMLNAALSEDWLLDISRMKDELRKIRL